MDTDGYIIVSNKDKQLVRVYGKCDKVSVGVHQYPRYQSQKIIKRKNKDEKKVFSLLPSRFSSYQLLFIKILRLWYPG